MYVDKAKESFESLFHLIDALHFVQREQDPGAVLILGEQLNEIRADPDKPDPAKGAARGKVVRTPT